MTDNDIVKVYEHMTLEQRLNHYRCMYYKDGDTTERGIIANAINDILPEYSRQKAEIERLEVELKVMRGAANSYKLHYDTIIKEFAAKLKSRCCKLTKYDEGGWDMDVYAVSTDDIDNLVKEMTEDENDG